ncbi:hypothetical protein [Arenimonas metalli]|uniref:STAS/SEC14 domain-containing protein n=1 Tax=Arenimonas metalli CF5-1 TaxID=1384056 RepID=A0A091B3T9_9GAMM|nr:hypothetical protein [Arenimonas metalli]KFN46386.1 hypothetical protein N787_11015 [Arenimonas metalli CF5-1]
MHWTVDYLANEHLVRVISDGNGPADRDQLRRLTREAMQAGHAHACPRFLIDHRLTRLQLGAAEIFDMPRRGEDGGFGHALRIAILITPDSPSRADFEFYAIQCGNLGIHGLRLFYDEAAALDWLTTP